MKMTLIKPMLNQYNIQCETSIRQLLDISNSLKLPKNFCTVLSIYCHHTKLCNKCSFHTECQQILFYLCMRIRNLKTLILLLLIHSYVIYIHFQWLDIRICIDRICRPPKDSEVLIYRAIC